MRDVLFSHDLMLTSTPLMTLAVVKQKLYDGCFMSSAPAAAPKAAAVAGAPPMPTFRPVIIPAGGAVPSSLDPPLVVKAVNNAEETFEGVAHTHAHAEPQVRSIPPSAYAAADGKAKEGEMEEGEVVSSSRGIHCSLSSTVLQQNGALEALLSDSSDHAPQNHENDPAPALAPVPVSALPAAVHDAAVMEMTTSPNGTNPDSCPQSNHLNNENGSEGQQPSVLKRARCEEGEVTEPPGKQLRV